MTYSIGQIARMLGTNTSTIRYYEKEGLLHSINRSASGVRRFTDEDLEQLKLVECLKKTGMPLKDIRDFVNMTLQGDDTISQRLALFEKQRKNVEEQILSLQNTLHVIEYKHWYYKTARQLGSTRAVSLIPPEKIPASARMGHDLLKDNCSNACGM